MASCTRASGAPAASSVFCFSHRCHPRVKSVLQAAIIASAGLLLAAAIPLAKDALIDPVTIGIACVIFGRLLTIKVDTLWIILEPAVISLLSSSFGLLAVLP